MLYICYPKCTTCQRAKAWLEAHGVEFTLRDIKAQKPSREFDGCQERQA